MRFDVVVVGGGLAGAAFAVALRGTSLRVALIQSDTLAFPEDWDQRIYAYSPSSAAFLRNLGVWANMRLDRVSAVREMHIFGDDGGELRFSAYESGLSELAWIGESSNVHRELWESLKRQHNVSLFYPERLKGIASLSDFAVLELESGTQLEAKLVVGADGRESIVRNMAGISATVAAYDERAVVANFRCEGAHLGTAFQWFRSDGVLAWLPLPDNVISVVWSAKDAFSNYLMDMDDADFCQHVATAGGHRLGLLSLITRRASFPLRLMRVDTVVKDRVALIGDAAHAIHPLSGHGINLGFQDAQALADELTAVRAWQDIGDYSVLRRYARKRAEEPFLMQYATHGLSKLFDSTNPFFKTARNVGLNLTARLPVVSNALVRYAANGRF